LAKAMMDRRKKVFVKGGGGGFGGRASRVGNVMRAKPRKEKKETVLELGGSSKLPRAVKKRVTSSTIN